ncbi:MAG: TlpA disulfide reductase family protein, partial [Lachnospiraceae bacterium]
LTIGSYPDTVLVAELLLERGPIEVEMKAKSEVRSPIQREYQQFRDSSAILGKRVGALNGTKAHEEAFRQYDLYRFQFKKKHIHNALGRSLFLDETGISDADLSAQLYELLSDKDKQRCDVRTDFENRKRRDKKQGLVDQPYLDFTLINADGKERRIADYVGKSKLLFLDFWASWCGPCIAQKPQIKELYEKYKGDGLEILSISLDENVDSWLAALKKSEKVFPELCAGSKERVKELRELYCITGIPDGILIDQSGKIIHAHCGYWLMLKYLLEAYYKK